MTEEFKDVLITAFVSINQM